MVYRREEGDGMQEVDGEARGAEAQEGTRIGEGEVPQNVVGGGAQHNAGGEAQDIAGEEPQNWAEEVHAHMDGIMEER